MRKILRAYDYIEEYLLAISLVFTVIVVFLQVIMRYIFNNSLSWSEELTRFIFIWQIWIGASIGIKYNKHIRVEIINKRFKMHRRKYAEISVLIICLAIVAFLTINGGMLVYRISLSRALSAAMRVPLTYVYAAVPVSGIMMMFRLIQSIYKESVGREV